MAPTCVSVLTPPGRSAIAVVEVAGPRSVEVVDACFLAANRRALGEQPLNAIRFGRWLAAEGEELVVCRTAEATVEVHCHGGQAAVRAVVASLADRDCVTQTWQQHVVATSASMIQAEARIALASCVTDRTAAILLDQLEGALEGELRAILSYLQLHDLKSVSEGLDTLRARSSLGLHLTDPWRVVLAGPPNVGKSSLINALVGYERAVVFDQPGVTRDVVTATTVIAGWPVELADTAGLRAANSSIEAAGVALARQVLANADLVLLVDEFRAVGSGDEQSEPTWAIEKELELAPHQSMLRLANKVDLAPAGWQASVPSLPISATTGDGVVELVDAIGDALVASPPPASGPAPFTRRQVDLIDAFAQAASEGDSAKCQAAVEALLAPAGSDLG